MASTTISGTQKIKKIKKKEKPSLELNASFLFHSIFRIWLNQYYWLYILHCPQKRLKNGEGDGSDYRQYPKSVITELGL